MKTKLLITSLSLIATSVYAQPSIPAVGMPPPTLRAEMPGQGVPSMPQPAMQRPAPQMNQSSPQPAVGATGGTGGNGGLIIGTGGTGGNGATPKPPSTMYSGVGPLPANDAKAPTSVGGNGGLLVGNGGNGGNGGAGVPKPDVAPLAIKSTPAQLKPPAGDVADCVFGLYNHCI